MSDLVFYPSKHQREMMCVLVSPTEKHRSLLPYDLVPPDVIEYRDTVWVYVRTASEQPGGSPRHYYRPARLTRM